MSRSYLNSPKHCESLFYLMAMGDAASSHLRPKHRLHVRLALLVLLVLLVLRSEVALNSS
jgi:hypothetical protein